MNLSKKTLADILVQIDMQINPSKYPHQNIPDRDILPELAEEYDVLKEFYETQKEYQIENDEQED